MLNDFEFQKKEDYDKMLELYRSLKRKDHDAVEIVERYKYMKDKVLSLLRILLNPFEKLIVLEIEFNNKLA